MRSPGRYYLVIREAKRLQADTKLRKRGTYSIQTYEEMKGGKINDRTSYFFLDTASAISPADILTSRSKPTGCSRSTWPFSNSQDESTKNDATRNVGSLSCRCLRMKHTVSHETETTQKWDTHLHMTQIYRLPT